MDLKREVMSKGEIATKFRSPFTLAESVFQKMMIKMRSQPCLKHTSANLGKMVQYQAFTRQSIFNRSFLGVCGLFTAVYGWSIYKSWNHQNENLRIGASGSLTFLICEACFFPLDAINL